MVIVSYAEPRDVRAVTAAGDTMTLRGVRELKGQVIRAAPDTLFVRVVAGQRPLLGPNDEPVIAVTRAADVRISTEAFSLGKTLFALAAVGLGAIAALALISLIACPAPCLA